MYTQIFLLALISAMVVNNIAQAADPIDLSNEEVKKGPFGSLFGPEGTDVGGRVANMNAVQLKDLFDRAVDVLMSIPDQSIDISIDQLFFQGLYRAQMERQKFADALSNSVAYWTHYQDSLETLRKYDLVAPRVFAKIDKL